MTSISLMGQGLMSWLKNNLGVHSVENLAGSNTYSFHYSFYYSGGLVGVRMFANRDPDGWDWFIWVDEQPPFSFITILETQFREAKKIRLRDGGVRVRFNPEDLLPESDLGVSVLSAAEEVKKEREYEKRAAELELASLPTDLKVDTSMEAEELRPRRQEDVRQITNRIYTYVNALLSNDELTLATLLADEYMGIQADGALLDKGDELAKVGTGAITYEVLKVAKVRMRFYMIIAVVTCLQTVKGQFHGHSYNGQNNCTQIWVRRNRRWLLLSTQSTPVIGGGSSYSSEEKREIIKRVIARVLEVDESKVNLKARLADLGGNYIDGIEIRNKLEFEYGVEILEGDAKGFQIMIDILESEPPRF